MAFSNEHGLIGQRFAPTPVRERTLQGLLAFELEQLNGDRISLRDGVEATGEQLRLAWTPDGGQSLVAELSLAEEAPANG